MLRQSLVVLAMLFSTFLTAGEKVDLADPDLRQFVTESGLGAYATMQLLSFDDTAARANTYEAYTLLTRKDSGKVEIYGVSLTFSKIGKTVMFSSPCQSPAPTQLLEGVLRIGEENLRFGFSCQKVGTLEGEERYEMYWMPFTGAGRTHIFNTMRSNDFVKVPLNQNMLIPFSTKGFAEAYERMGDPPI